MSLRDILQKQAEEKRAQEQARQEAAQQKAASATNGGGTSPTPTQSVAPTKPNGGGFLSRVAKITGNQPATLSQESFVTPQQDKPVVVEPEKPHVAPISSASSLEAALEKAANTEVGVDIPAKVDPNDKDAFAAAVAELKKQIAFLSENIDQTGLVGQVVRTIMMQLQRNPQFATGLVDSDYTVLSRAFRRSHNVAQRKLQEKGEKKSVKRKDKSEFANFMSDMGSFLKE